MAEACSMDGRPDEREQEKANIRNAKNLPSIEYQENWSPNILRFGKLLRFVLLFFCTPSNISYPDLTLQDYDIRILRNVRKYSPYRQTDRHVAEELNLQQRRCELVQLYAVRLLAVPIKVFVFSLSYSRQQPVQKLYKNCSCTSLSVVLFRFLIQFRISKYSKQCYNFIKYSTKRQKKVRDNILK